MMKAVLSRKNIFECKEYISCVFDLIENENIQKLGKFGHHIGTTRLQHSLNVSYYNFLLCRFLKLDAKSAARAGLMHDLFFYDRRKHEKGLGESSHISEHPKIAFFNASEMFSINELEGDMIINHMWPMTLHLPRHKETFIITLVDKFCAVAEVAVSMRSRFKRRKGAASTQGVVAADLD
ncbi:MAG: HAD family hydrolase [Oscillospiraceae bacterium]|nr:HAD family hydrolase [Oscillospiraceae bacterium]